VAGFYLNNHKGAVLEADNISFKPSAVPIAFDNDQAISFKVARGDLLAPRARWALQDRY
jgi:hypothetical protein